MTPSVIGSIVRAKLGGVTGLDRFVVLSTLLGPRIVSVSEREHHPFPLRNAPRRRNAPGQLAAPPRPPHSALTRHCSSSTSAGCVIGPGSRITSRLVCLRRMPLRRMLLRRWSRISSASGSRPVTDSEPPGQASVRSAGRPPVGDLARPLAVRTHGNRQGPRRP